MFIQKTYQNSNSVWEPPQIILVWKFGNIPILHHRNSTKVHDPNPAFNLWQHGISTEVGELEGFLERMEAEVYEDPWCFLCQVATFRKGEKVLDKLVKLVTWRNCSVFLLFLMFLLLGFGLEVSQGGPWFGFHFSITDCDWVDATASIMTDVRTCMYGMSPDLYAWAKSWKSSFKMTTMVMVWINPPTQHAIVTSKMTVHF